MKGKDENIASQANSLSGDDERVTKLLYSLPRVEASKDFEFKVKARIAQTKSAPRRPSYIKALAYILPIFLVLVAASIFFLRQPSNAGEEEISAVQPSVAVPEEQPVVNQVAEEAPLPVASKPDPSTPTTSTRQATIVNNKQPAETITTGGRGRHIRGGSFDSALSPSNTILPRGFKVPDIQRTTNPDAPNQKPTVGEVLRTYGVSASHGAGGWTVSGVSGNAAKAGIQKGDVIEMAQTDANGTHISVKRGGSNLQISLKP